MRWVAGLVGVLAVILLVAIALAYFTTRVDPATTEGPPPITVTATGALPKEGERALPPPVRPGTTLDRAQPPPAGGAVVPGTTAPGSVQPPASATGTAAGGATPPSSTATHSDGGVPFPLTKDGIRGAIGSKLPEIKECYESWLEQNPKLEGKLKVSFAITGDDAGLEGEVTEIVVLDGGMGHVLMEGCVLNVFRDLRFEHPDDGVMHVTYPLAFSSGDGG